MVKDALEAVEKWEPLGVEEFNQQYRELFDSTGLSIEEVKKLAGLPWALQNLQRWYKDGAVICNDGNRGWLVATLRYCLEDLIVSPEDDSESFSRV